MNIDAIAESRIREAAARGEFDDLPGHGERLELDDDSHIPEPLRVAYRILKNAGCVPPEVEARKELASIEALIDATGCSETRSRAERKLSYLRMKLAATRPEIERLQLTTEYESAVRDAMGTRSDDLRR